MDPAEADDIRALIPETLGVIDVLGSRHLVQAAVTARAPSALVLRAGAQVDLAHAASMLVLGAVGRPLRRAQLADGSVAAIFAALGAAGAARGGTGRFVSPCQGQPKGNLQHRNERNYPCISVSGRSLSS